MSWCRQVLHYSVYRGKYLDKSISTRPSLNIKTTRNHRYSILLVFLIASGDVELNPGPIATFSSESLSPDCTKSVWQLQWLHNKLISSELHQHFLSLYKRNDITPPGLKIKLIPQVGSTLFLDRWTDIIKESSTRLLDLLIESHAAKCVTLRNQITKTLSILSNKLSPSQLLKIKHWLKSCNENTRAYLTYRKQQKLDKHLALQEHNGDRTKTSLSPTTIWNDYRNNCDSLFKSPNPASDVSRDHPESQPEHIQSTTSAPRNHKRKSPHNPIRRTHNPRNSHPTSASRQTNNTVSSTSNCDNTSRSINRSVIPSTHTRPVNSTHTTSRKQHRRYHRGRRNIKSRANSSNNLKTVINLSDRELSEHEVSILSKGRKYVSTPTSVNKTKLITDVKRWGPRVRSKEYFWGCCSSAKKERLSNWSVQTTKWHWRKLRKGLSPRTDRPNIWLCYQREGCCLRGSFQRGN